MGSMGDGIWRLLGIALTMVNAKGKVLLIDEIDTGFHYSVMVDFWKLIWKTACELDMQIFATTHSRDCWEALAEVIAINEISADEIMVHRIEINKNESIPFTSRQLVIAANRDLEVR